MMILGLLLNFLLIRSYVEIGVYMMGISDLPESFMLLKTDALNCIKFGPPG